MPCDERLIAIVIMEFRTNWRQKAWRLAAAQVFFSSCSRHRLSADFIFIFLRFSLCSLPLTIGPPVAGYIYDTVGTYTPAFLAAGIPPIVGATVMFSIRCIKSGEKSETGETTKKLTSSETQDTVVPDA